MITIWPGPGEAISLPADIQKLSEVKMLISEIEKREDGSKCCNWELKKPIILYLIDRYKKFYFL